VLGDKELETVLSRAPTYLGLERVMRYCLVRFAESTGIINAGTALVSVGGEG